ncbi:MAG: AAA family ATPase [Bacteroides sp.]|nr:AAA family ATPase [Bacteroides sp.]
MKTIAFYSYKGGVGRTLALSNIAMRLADFGKKVVMLDFDLEAPGLHCKFADFSKGKSLNKGIVDYLYEFHKNHQIPPSIKEYGKSMHNTTRPMFLIPAGNPNSSDYWRKLSSINWFELFYGEQALGVPFFLDMKQKIEKELAPDYFLIDTRTGITDISNLTLSLLADQVVILSANNKENIEGCQRIVRSILNKENALLEQKKDIILSLTRIPSPTTPEEKLLEENIRRRFQFQFSDLSYPSGEPLNAVPVVIHSNREMEYNECFKLGYEKEIRSTPDTTANEYMELFERITAKDLTQKEIQKFNEEKARGRLLCRIRQATGKTMVFELLEEAEKKYPNDSEVQYLYATNLLIIGKTSEALIQIEKAIDSVKYHRTSYFLKKSEILCVMGRYNEAYDVIYPFRTVSPNYLFIYCQTLIMKKNTSSEEIANTIELLKNSSYNMGDIYNLIAVYERMRGNYDEALKNIYQALELDKEESMYYSTLAEIKAEQNDIPQFYLNIDIALDKGLDLEYTIKQVPEIYGKFKNDEKFISLLKRYEKYNEIELLQQL